MMVFMSKKMALEAAKQQEKRDKETKAIRNLSIAAVAIGGVNLVRGVVGNISAHRDLKTIKNKVFTWDEYFKTDAEDEEVPADQTQQPVVVDPKQQPVVVDPKQQPVVVDPKQEQQQQ